MWIHWNYPQMIDKKSERPICWWAQKISSRKIKLCMFLSLYVNVFEIVENIFLLLSPTGAGAANFDFLEH